MNSVDDSAAPRRLFWHRVRFLALIAVFLSPFIGGWFAFYVFELRPASGNYGTLVQPVRKIDWPLLESTDGARHEGGFGRKWTLLLFAGERCAEQCRSNLFYIRQIRTLLGRNTSRLQNVLVMAGDPDADLAAFLDQYPRLAVIAGERRDALYRQFRLDGQGEVGAEARLYLVDPEQNLMMHYPAQFDEKRVLEDLRKLMKVSQIG